ncbi:MAG: hypothetical protein ACU0FH_01860 [Heliomarina sp.]|uniref:hypothetical protein n=1 Tax=Heliomarina TaxID=2917553 RepID=UPI001EE303D8|nr:hypothetical protein [Heliomarina baculiformis]
MKNEDDPKGLIREAYRIDGITLAECRSIFLDWALSLPADADTAPAIERLSGHYGPDHPDHPMTAVLAEGKTTLTTPRRRGGWRSRPRN